MKTFETEKHNIPEGATHYLNETDTDCFAWYREDTKEVMVDGYVAPEWESAGKDENLADMKPIPQTKEVEWDGEYQLEGGKDWFKYKTTYTSSSGDMFAMCLVPSANKGKPFEQYLDLATTKVRALETEAERAERERLEAAYDLYRDYCDGTSFKGVGFDLFKDPTDNREVWLAIVRKTGYRKESE